jgi:hypothetical protein
VVPAVKNIPCLLRRRPAPKHRVPTWALAVVAVLCAWLSGFFFGKAAGSELDEYTREDRVLHLGAGFAIGATTYALVQTVAPDLDGWKKHALAIGVSALVGIAKEWCDDEGRGDCDARDAIATVGGGVLGSISVSLVFRF